MSKNFGLGETSLRGVLCTSNQHYVVRVYCAIPKGLILTESAREFLHRKGLSDDNYKELVFESTAALFYYVRGFDYIDRYNCVRNSVLDATMCSVKESRRHAVSIDRRYGVVNESGYSFGCYYYLGYHIRSADGTVIDLRNYIKELYSFDVQAYASIVNDERRELYANKWRVREARWEKSRKLYEGEDYWSYYRRVRTTQERRFAADKENKLHIRGKRSVCNIPSAWDDLYFHREKSWKARNKKARRQWAVNLHKHVDTLKMSSPCDDGEGAYCKTNPAVCHCLFDS